MTRRALARSATGLLLGLTLTALGLTALGSTAVGATAPTPAGPAPNGPASPGSASGGDPYFPWDGNGGYDVRHYDIAITYRPGSGSLRGTAVVRATARKRLSRLNLDLALRVDRVTVNGRRARFTKPTRHELRVTPRRSIPEGRPFHVKVRYHHPSPHRVTATGARPVFHRPGEGLALGQPQAGAWWFPANETPTDKATFAVAVRVPRGREAVSNGVLVSATRHGRWRTWSWRADEPMATYLAFFAAGDLTVRRGTAAGRPYVYTVSRALGSGARNAALRLMRRTPGVVAWLEEQFGPYPFATVGGVTTGLDPGFALETQGRPVYPYVGGPGPWAVSLVVHEQAHQWFGDSVSVRRWRDIWLNEGLATYAEWLYAADHGGPSVQRRLDDEYARPPGSAFWRLRLSDPGPERMFDWAVYNRGAMTVAALRNRIGAADVETLLRTWAADRAGGHGTTAQFTALAEQVSGEDLDGFFDAWLHSTERPADTVDNGLG